MVIGSTTQSLAHRCTRPAVQLHRFRDQGRVRRVARGVHHVVPEDAGPEWRPSLEALAAGVASAVYGECVPVLMHLSPARLHGATPRALAGAVVAVPRQHPVMVVGDREDARVLFVERDTDALDAQLMSTDLGPALRRRPAGEPRPGSAWASRARPGPADPLINGTPTSRRSTRRSSSAAP